MNFISIDPSIKSTAIVINETHFINFPNKELIFTKKGELTKWFDLAQKIVEYIPVEYATTDKSYSDTEMDKLVAFDLISQLIVDSIVKYCDLSLLTYVGIEGYSYNSEAGNLADLASFSAILRNKLYFAVSKNITVFSPKEVKSGAAKLTYPPIPLNKKETKFIWRNNDGIPGGNFDKPEILQSILDNNSYTNKYVDFIKSNVDFTTMKIVKKPFDDMNDAFIIYKMLYNLVTQNGTNSSSNQSIA